MAQKSLFPFIPFLLLVIPILEIGVFIIVGGQIGVINTLLGILLTAIVGTVLLRRQGFALIGQAQQQMNTGKIPGKEMAHGVMLLAAGLLLLTPGFVTDTLGFLLLVPPIRDAIFAYLKTRLVMTDIGGAASGFSSFSFGRSYDSTARGPNAGQSYQRYERNDDPSIIDLDENEFNEVGEHDAIEHGNSRRSPWNKS